MGSVKIVLRKKQNKDGSFPLAVRITKDRKASFIHLGYNVHEKDWDAVKQQVKKSHPNSTRLNNFLITKRAEANNKSLEMETERKEVSSQAVKQKIKPVGGATFFSQAAIYLDTLKAEGKYNRYTADQSRVKRFKEFLKGSDIAFSDITVPLLEKFKIYMRHTAKIGERTAVNHLVVVRSVFSQAIKAQITDRKYYPFGPEKIQIKFPESIKIGLTPEEVNQLEETELPEGSFENHSRNLWLFSFYFAGMRASDVLRIRWSDIQDDRLYYTMGKNNKAGSLKIPAKVLGIIAQYKEQQRSLDDLIFPDLKVLPHLEDNFIVQRRIMNTVSRVDKFLRLHVAPKAKITKKLTMHIARHTFGNISGDRIPIPMLQKLYRHSSVTTTIGYQGNFIHKSADEALEAVLDF